MSIPAPDRPVHIDCPEIDSVSFASPEIIKAALEKCEDAADVEEVIYALRQAERDRLEAIYPVEVVTAPARNFWSAVETLAWAAVIIAALWIIHLHDR